MTDAHFRPIGGPTPRNGPPSTGSPRPSPRDAGAMLRGWSTTRGPGPWAAWPVTRACSARPMTWPSSPRRSWTGARADGTRLLAPLTVRAMIDPGDTRRASGEGWAGTSRRLTAARGGAVRPDGFGHTGFTGTSLWIDPETETFVILLTSRLHPDGREARRPPLRSEVATLAAAALDDAPAPVPARAAVASPARRWPVDCGIDVLVERRLRAVAGPEGRPGHQPYRPDQRRPRPSTSCFNAPE